MFCRFNGRIDGLLIGRTDGRMVLAVLALIRRMVGRLDGYLDNRRFAG
jgi:hypothetical protein